MITWQKPITSLSKGIERYKKALAFNMTNGADKKAKIEAGLALLNFCANGSSREPVVPPIKDGILRGSGSVFAGNTLAGDTKGISEGTPATSYNGKPSDITIGYNTKYAARMHETNWAPGEQSKTAGNVGNKWIEKHIKADGKDIFALYAKKVKEYSGG